MAEEGVWHVCIEFLRSTGNESQAADDFVGFRDILGGRAKEGRRSYHEFNFILEDELVCSGGDAIHGAFEIVGYELNIILLALHFDPTGSINHIRSQFGFISLYCIKP